MSNMREKTLPAIPARLGEEKIIVVSHEYGAAVTVSLATLYEGMQVDFRTVRISGADYELLMSDDVPWDALKPAGRWRDEDLFALIDVIDNR